MPCSCKKPLPEYPDNAHWGPILWSVLHALAQKSGRAIFPTFRDDEVRQWINLIQVMPQMIPCDNCRTHVKEWLVRRPITDIKNLPYASLNDWIITWVYDLHEEVNQRLGKPSFDKALLGSTYNSISIHGALNALKPFIETAIRLSGITLFPWNNFVGYAKALCSYYGV